MKIQNRRRFFKNITLGAIGISVLNSFPVKLIAGNRKSNVNSVSKVKIHNQAVKRSR
ncbi:MAG: hypothetical protein K8F60_14925 [Melioribacteraceae bacterium]|nr:hypothetical protein [Melioribacteraceae bacterium]